MKLKMWLFLIQISSILLIIFFFQVCQLLNHAATDWDPNHFIEIGEPCIIKPVELYSGKQVITFLLNNIIPNGREGITTDKRTRMPQDVWNGISTPDSMPFHEGHVIFLNNYFCTGNFLV